MITGLPQDHRVTAEEIREALQEPVSQIVEAVTQTLDRTPPELAADIVDNGITLAGGGALLRGMDQRMREECQMPCQLTESPVTSVAVGSGRSHEEFEVIHRMSRTERAASCRRRRLAHVPKAGKEAPGGAGGADRASLILLSIHFSEARAGRCTRSSVGSPRSSLPPSRSPRRR